MPEFDEDMVIDELEPIMSAGGVVIDFHSSGFFPERVTLIHFRGSGLIWSYCSGPATPSSSIA